MTYGLWCIRKCIQIILNHRTHMGIFLCFCLFYLSEKPPLHTYTHTPTIQPSGPQLIQQGSEVNRKWTGSGPWRTVLVSDRYNWSRRRSSPWTHTHARTQSCSRHTVMSPNPFPFLHKTTHRNILMHVYTHAHLLKPSHTHINTVGWYNVMWKLACLRAVCSPSPTFSPFVLPHRLNHTH